MTNFNYKKFLTENKLTQTTKLRAGILAEGQFSWMTQDTNQQIGSQEENMIPVYMYDNEGNSYYESNYDGYGEFGGVDYYELLDKMNGGDGDRSRGIDLAFEKIKTDSEILYPALVTKPNFNWKSHDFTQQPKNDPNQSWYMEPEEDDYNDEDYGDYNDDEDDMMEGKKKYYKDAEADDAEHIKALEKDMKDDKKSSKMKKSDLKAKIKEMIVAEMNINEDTFAPESEEDFLAEVDRILKENNDESLETLSDSELIELANDEGMEEMIVRDGEGFLANREEIISGLKSTNGLNEANEFDTNKPARIAEFITALNRLVDEYHGELYLKDEVFEGVMMIIKAAKEEAMNLNEANEFDTNKPARIAEFITALNRLVDDYHPELYLNDDLFAAISMVIKAAKEEAMNLNEADEEVAVDDTEVAVDGEENIDVDTTVKVDPNVKSVQDALTQAQAAAQKLGDSKLTDQIGNTITFFTRTHVVDQGAVAEGVNESMFPLLKRILK